MIERRRRSVMVGTAVLAGALGSTNASSAQEMLNMPAATSPSPGVLIPRAQARAYFYEGGQTLLEEDVRLEYGVARDLAISLDLPMFQGFFDEPRPSDGDFGLGDLEAIVELRILREDLGAVDTLRGAVYAGAELPTGTGGFGSSGADPCAGGVLTGIFGRHGFDIGARWTFVTDESPFLPTFGGTTADDYANLDLGYAFRLYPDAYGEEREAAWYATSELNSIWTAGSEYEILISPGLLLEAPTFAVELGLQIPLAWEVDDAPNLRLAALVGLRLIF